MNEARNQRFEIDIDEIERQLRRSVEQPSERQPDPLAELARIVGQNDPFQGILTHGQPPRGASEAANANHVADPLHHPLTEHDFAHDHLQAAHQGYDAAYDAHHAYDPVADVYGSADDALAEPEFQPLRRRPSRGKLIAVAAALVVTVSAVGAGMMWRKPGGLLASAPPTIVADKSPLKVPPENPGGAEVPNQDRQIYTRAQQDGQSRIVDGREQPVDVRAATPAISARAPVPSSPISDALGEPRRVRTVAVNPDGTGYPSADPAAMTPSARGSQGMIPSGDLPTPTPVQSVAVPARGAATPTPAQVETTSSHQAVSVLPPARPTSLVKPAVATDAPTRTASVSPADTAKPAAAPKPKPAADAKPAAAVARTETPAADKPAAGPKTFTVQIASRASEDEARKAWDQAQTKFGDSLENKPARLTSAEVGGKTVHRVRLGPMTKPEADAMCTRLKAKGGTCSVASN